MTNRTNRQTDGQTDDSIMPIADDYCVPVRSAKNYIGKAAEFQVVCCLTAQLLEDTVSAIINADTILCRN